MKLKELPQLWAIPYTGQVVVIHPPEACIPPCPVHFPTEHKMRPWPLYLCGTRMVRICKHGICHPDPDDRNAPNEHACCEEQCCAGAYVLGC